MSLAAPGSRPHHWLMRPGLCRGWSSVARYLVTAALVSTLLASTFASSTVEAFGARVESRILRLMSDYDVPGVAVALIQGGELVWSAAYGLAEVETARPLDLDAVVRAESISKSVTAWGVMKLVENGRIGLDDRIFDHVRRLQVRPDGLGAGSVTVRQLLSHTAGVTMGTLGREYAPGAEVPALAQTLAAEFGMFAEPGTTFAYSNTGFNLLELLVEEVAGEPFADFMQREVLDPLGMAASSFEWREELAARVALGHDLDGGVVPAYVYPEKGSGGLMSTVEDLARFVGAGFRAGDLLLPETIAQLHSPTADIMGLFRVASPTYGLGHFVETLSNGERAVWHGGQGHGWMTDFHLVPATGDGIVIVSNSQRSWPLVASALAEWSEWNGFAPVGFAVVARAPLLARVLIGLLAGASLWLTWRVVAGLGSGRRALWPLAGARPWLQLAQATAGAALAAAVVWDATRDYSFLDSVLPGIAVWLRIAVGGFAAALALSALSPVRPERRPRAIGAR